MTRYLLFSLGPAALAWLALDVCPAPELAGAVGIAIAVVAFVVAEAIIATRAEISRRVVGRDLVHAVLSSATAQLCLIAATWFIGFVDREPLQWPLLLQVACIVVGSDFLAYLAHLAQHRVRLLWAPHALHHSPRELYWLNGLRAHPGDTAWAFAASTVWVLVAGFTVEAFAVAGVITTSHLLLQHTRVQFPRYLETLLVTPAWHRIHHDRTTAERAANLGQIFTLWDRLCGTFRPSDPAPAALGIGEDYPDTLAGELMLPWRIFRKGPASEPRGNRG